MGFSFRLLILSLPIMVLFSTPAEAGQQRCLGCHGRHYVEKGPCVACHRGDDRTDRKRVAHDGLIPGRYAWFTLRGAYPVERGRKLIDTFACRRCHTINGKGNRLAANLDNLPSLRQPREIARAIQAPVRSMPDFRLADQEITDMVNAIFAASAVKKTSETPLLVHFQEKAPRENIFEKRCGACHRMLSSRDGGVGRGEIGPNLSGLLSPFYPATFHNRERWSTANLKKWLANPRRIRSMALMQPIPVNEKDFASLIDILQQ